MTVAEKLVAELLEADPPKGRAVAFGPSTGQNGLYAHNLIELLRMLRRYGMIEPEGPTPDDFLAAVKQAFGILQNKDGALTLMGAPKLHMDKRAYTQSMEWLGLDPDTTENLQYTDSQGKRVEKPTKETLMATDAYKDYAEQMAAILGRQRGTAQQQRGEETHLRQALGYRHAGKAVLPIDPEKEKAFRAKITGMSIGQEAYLGIIDSHYVNGRDGMVVDEIDPKGPLAQAGVRVGDTLMSINRKRIVDKKAYVQVAKALVAGVPYTIRVVRRNRHWNARIVAVPPRQETGEQPSA